VSLDHTIPAHRCDAEIFGLNGAALSALLRGFIKLTIRAPPKNRQWPRLMSNDRSASNTGWVRGLALGAALCLYIALGADRASLAAPPDELIAALSADGDQSSVQTTQEPDGRAKVVVRGDLFDGRRFLRAIVAGLTELDPNGSAFDIDLDIKLVTLMGFNGQALHDVTLKLANRDGKMLEFGLTSKLGLADLSCGLGRGRDGRSMIYLEANDAGAFFRFANVYQHIKKGRMRVAMDIPPAAHAAPKGTLTIYDFSLVSKETFKSLRTPQLKAKSEPDELKLSRLRFDFQMFPHRVVVIDGLLRGPTLAATVSGKIDIANNDLSVADRIEYASPTIGREREANYAESMIHESPASGTR
jgi:hypothetical protein